MDPGHRLSTGEPDYRGNRLGEGNRCDAQLATAPFNVYLSAWERRRLPVMLELVPGASRRCLDSCGNTESMSPHHGNEARFATARLKPVAPNVIVVVRKA